MEAAVLIVFICVLTGCIAAGISVLYALAAGLLLFIVYGALKGFSARALAGMCVRGAREIKTMLITFMLIGLLTAIWRSSGCIPAIVCYASELIYPRILILMTFLLTAAVSMLTGSAYCTAATMGVICVSIASSMDIPLFWVGGAVLSGAVLGNRSSPVSSSVLFVSSQTKTDIYGNIRNMTRSALIPFCLSCVIYALAGLAVSGTEGGMDVGAMFESEFTVSPVCILPAAILLVMAVLRVGVKTVMAVSILTAIPIALFVQNTPALTLLKDMIYGFSAASPQLGKMINGGGALSMVQVSLILLIGSFYSGIFKETGLLNFLKAPIERAGEKFGHFAVFLAASVFFVSVACNQALAIILVNQMVSPIEPDNELRANYIADTTIPVASLIPWSVMAAVPLSSAGAPLICILGACYIYLLPLCGLLRFRKRAISVKKSRI